MYIADYLLSIEIDKEKQSVPTTDSLLMSHLFLGCIQKASSSLRGIGNLVTGYLSITEQARGYPSDSLKD